MGQEKLRKIPIDDLKLGMYIVQLDRPWIAHPFLISKKRITAEKQIAKLKEYGIRHVYIDLEKSRMDPEAISPSPDPPPDPGAPVSRPALQEEKMEERLFSPHSEPPLLPKDPVPFHQEIETARMVQQEAHAVIRGVMRQARLGRNIESEGVKRVVNKMVESIFRNRDALLSLTRIKGYDEYTFVHSINVCIFCLTMGRHIQFSREMLEHFGIGALLHDVGKMRVPHRILNKPGKITPEERAEIQRHPIYGMEILEAASKIPEHSKQMALQHHERCNGQGYPYGLREEEISALSQIAGIIDVYDAMTTDRVYKKACPPHVAIKEIYRSIQSEFNRSLVERFIQCVGIYPVGTLVLLDTGEIGVVVALNPEKLLRPTVLLLFQNSKIRYPQPRLVDLMEETEQYGQYKRTIETALDPQRWGIRVEDYIPGSTKGFGEVAHSHR
jgi:HD-GYP domain-containing protein (c-di-GMP phosphodiesterase class II)